jgi:hypothetical protein
MLYVTDENIMGCCCSQPISIMHADGDITAVIIALKLQGATQFGAATTSMTCLLSSVVVKVRPNIHYSLAGGTTTPSHLSDNALLVLPASN